MAKKKPNCKGCGLCCIFAGHVFVDPEDVKREPRLKELGKPVACSIQLNLSIGKQHGEVYPARPGRKASRPHHECVFLNTRRNCSIYATRPDVCRTFIPGNRGCVVALDRGYKRGFKRGVRDKLWD
jgi:Fe-S-cluster containining protein